MIKRFNTFGIMLILLSVILTGCNGSSMTSVWSYSGLTHNEEDDSWEINAKKVNGHTTRKIKFTSDNLTALNAESTNSDGKVSMLLIQGDTKKTVDMSGEYSGSIDMGDFEAGHIELRLEFENAENVALSICW